MKLSMKLISYRKTYWKLKMIENASLNGNFINFTVFSYKMIKKVIEKLSKKLSKSYRKLLEKRKLIFLFII